MNVFQRCTYSLMRTTRLGLFAGALKDRYTEISLLSKKQTSLVSYERERKHVDNYYFFSVQELFASPQENIHNLVYDFTKFQY